MSTKCKQALQRRTEVSFPCFFCGEESAVLSFCAHVNSNMSALVLQPLVSTWRHSRFELSPHSQLSKFGSMQYISCSTLFCIQEAPKFPCKFAEQWMFSCGGYNKFLYDPCAMSSISRRQYPYDRSVRQLLHTKKVKKHDQDKQPRVASAAVEHTYPVGDAQHSAGSKM